MSDLTFLIFGFLIGYIFFIIGRIIYIDFQIRALKKENLELDRINNLNDADFTNFILLNDLKFGKRK